MFNNFFLILFVAGVSSIKVGAQTNRQPNEQRLENLVHEREKTWEDNRFVLAAIGLATLVGVVAYYRGGLTKRQTVNTPQRKKSLGQVVYQKPTVDSKDRKQTQTVFNTPQRKKSFGQTAHQEPKIESESEETTKRQTVFNTFQGKKSLGQVVHQEPTVVDSKESIESEERKKIRQHLTTQLERALEEDFKEKKTEQTKLFLTQNKEQFKGEKGISLGSVMLGKNKTKEERKKLGINILPVNGLPFIKYIVRNTHCHPLALFLIKNQFKLTENNQKAFDFDLAFRGDENKDYFIFQAYHGLRDRDKEKLRNFTGKTMPTKGRAELFYLFLACFIEKCTDVIERKKNLLPESVSDDFWNGSLERGCS